MSSKKFTPLQLQFITTVGLNRNWGGFHKDGISSKELPTYRSLIHRGLLKNTGYGEVQWTGIARKAFGGEGVTIDET